MQRIGIRSLFLEVGVFEFFNNKKSVFLVAHLRIDKRASYCAEIVRSLLFFPSPGNGSLASNKIVKVLYLNDKKFLASTILCVLCLTLPSSFISAYLSQL